MKILFMVDYWAPKATTNAVCAKNIAQELIKKGNEVYVCAFGNGKQKDLDDNGIKVSFVKPTLARLFLTKSKETKNKYYAKLYKLMGLILNRLRRFILFPLYPVVSLSLAHRCSKKITKMINIYNIDCVISVIAPDDSLYTGYLCKKANSSVVWIPYYLDNGSNLLPGASFEKVKAMLKKKYQKWENKVLEKADGIIIMKGHEKYYRKTLSDENLKKLQVANVPLFVISESIEEKEKKADNEVWMYAGNMSGKYYDPHTIVDVFNKYNKNNKAYLKLFGPTDKISYVESASKNSNIKWYGNVSHDKLVSEYLSSDVLVFYINGVLDSVSGKFFEYLKYEKIIIYIGDKNDINANLVKKYNKGIIISNANRHEDIKKTSSEINKLKKRKIEKEKLLKVYEKSTPEYSIKLITKIMEGKYNEIN